MWACARGAVQLREGMEGSQALNPQQTRFYSWEQLQSHIPCNNTAAEPWPTWHWAAELTQPKAHTSGQLRRSTEQKSNKTFKLLKSSPFGGSPALITSCISTTGRCCEPRAQCAAHRHGQGWTWASHQDFRLRALQHGELQASNAEREALLRCTDPGRQQEAGGGRGGEH